MRNDFGRINCIFHFIGNLLVILGGVLLVPVIVAVIYQGQYGDGPLTISAFVISAVISFLLGEVMRKVFRPEKLDITSSMLICTVGWLIASLMGALPFVMSVKISFLNAYFEAVSGFTTTGITMFTGLENMPRSILFWRGFMQWLGGFGILSFFLVVTFRGGGAHFLFGAESHKISSGRPAPGLFNTLKILWGIYALFTLLGATALIMEGMGVFDSICHSFTAVGTGGFSTHDSSIGYYQMAGYANYRLIEYTIIFLMILGGMNFLVHYRVLTGDFKALWDNIEIRYLWRLLMIFIAIIVLDRFRRAGIISRIYTGSGTSFAEMEQVFRQSVFQVVSIITTAGFATQHIGSDLYGVLSRQLFLIMMVIGGCVGSTSGGFKILRVAILDRLMVREIFRVKHFGHVSAEVVIDRKIVPADDVRRVAALFFGWIGLLIIGSGITAIFSDYGMSESASGMFSALGNIGPCYIPAQEIININPIVKITYIFAMLAGRLEILPVLLLFSKDVWKDR